MTSKLNQIAREAGFMTHDDIRGKATTSNGSESISFCGLDFVSAEIMPDGWIGVRTENGVTCIGPRGGFFVPFFGPHDKIDVFRDRLEGSAGFGVLSEGAAVEVDSTATSGPRSPSPQSTEGG